MSCPSPACRPTVSLPAEGPVPLLTWLPPKPPPTKTTPHPVRTSTDDHSCNDRSPGAGPPPPGRNCVGRLGRCGVDEELPDQERQRPVLLLGCLSRSSDQ